MAQHKYSDCSYCGGKVKPQKTTLDSWWEGKFYIFEDVPAGVCQQCGEKYLTAKVAKRIESSTEKMRWRKFREVPVTSYQLLPS